MNLIRLMLCTTLLATGSKSKAGTSFTPPAGFKEVEGSFEIRSEKQLKPEQEEFLAGFVEDMYGLISSIAPRDEVLQRLGRNPSVHVKVHTVVKFARDGEKCQDLVFVEKREGAPKELELILNGDRILESRFFEADFRLTNLVVGFGAEVAGKLGAIPFYLNHSRSGVLELMERIAKIKYLNALSKSDFVKSLPASVQTEINLELETLHNMNQLEDLSQLTDPCSIPFLSTAAGKG